MIMGKHGAVIGLNNPMTWTFRLGTYKDASLLANHIAVFAHDHQNTEFRPDYSVKYSG
jgi:hypothetical protein